MSEYVFLVSCSPAQTPQTGPVAYVLRSCLIAEDNVSYHDLKHVTGFS